jgi:antitoxin (DNA-binding transcriptional repressor) of toxin-antitoxin stability system
MTSIHEFEAHVDVYLREAQSGETVRVTDQGRVVAELRPPAEEQEQPATRQERYRQLVTRGVIQPAATPDDRSWTAWPGLGVASGSVQALLDAEREE